jgi:hypothetical protein
MRVHKIEPKETFNPPIIEVTLHAERGVLITVALEHKDYALSELKDAAVAKAREALQMAIGETR